METRVYYNVGRENVELVYYNTVGSDAEAGPSEETEYHQYDEIPLQGGSEDQQYDDIDLPGESEDQQYDDIDLPGGSEAGPGSEEPGHHVYEVDL